MNAGGRNRFEPRRASFELCQLGRVRAWELMLRPRVEVMDPRLQQILDPEIITKVQIEDARTQSSDLAEIK